MKAKYDKSRPTKLEMANEMYKFAFSVKKSRFKNQFPNLSSAEIQQKTVDFFKKLSNEES